MIKTHAKVASFMLLGMLLSSKLGHERTNQVRLETTIGQITAINDYFDGQNHGITIFFKDKSQENYIDTNENFKFDNNDYGWRVDEFNQFDYPFTNEEKYIIKFNYAIRRLKWA